MTLGDLIMKLLTTITIALLLSISITAQNQYAKEDIGQLKKDIEEGCAYVVGFDDLEFRFAPNREAAIIKYELERCGDKGTTDSYAYQRLTQIEQYMERDCVGFVLINKMTQEVNDNKRIWYIQHNKCTK